MSSSIKPPGGPSGGPPPAEIGRPDATGEPGSASEAFGQALERPSGPEEVGPEEARPEEAAGTMASQAAGVDQITADLRSGKLDVEGAIDRLVERAMASGAAEALSAAGRAELETYLRKTLVDDPTLVALTRDLARGD